MTVVDSIVVSVCFVSYSAVTFFAMEAWYMLRRQKSILEDIMFRQNRMGNIVFAEYVITNFEVLNRLKEQLRELVKDERYDQAEKMKGFIKEAEENAMYSLKKFREVYGDADGINIKDDQTVC